MTKKKKTVITLGIISILIISLFGKYQYTKYQLNENLKLAEIRSVFLVVNPEDKNLRKSNYTNTELKEFNKNPPKIEMDTARGLGLKVSAYNYYNAGDIDPYAIKEMMENGQFHDAYEYTIGFVDWANKNEAAVSTYERALEYAASKLGISLPIDGNERTYKNYLEFINNPESNKYIEEYYAR